MRKYLQKRIFPSVTARTRRNKIFQKSTNIEGKQKPLNRFVSARVEFNVVGSIQDISKIALNIPHPGSHPKRKLSKKNKGTLKRASPEGETQSNENHLNQ